MQTSERTRLVWSSILDAHRGGNCLVMGILNVTPDSFSDGGQHSTVETAVQHALEMAGEGADIIDIGGESTRPGALGVSVDEELNRVIPVVELLRKQSDIPISVDTRKAAVAEAAVQAGADIINDISALRDDPGMIEVVRSHVVPVIVMHMQGTPATMQQAPHYTDVVAEVSAFLADRIAFCRSADVEYIIADPGIGFGKRLEDNIELIRRLEAFRTLDVPLLMGVSRKAFIGVLTGDDVQHRLGGSIAAAVLSAMNGASIVRVHDVRDTKSALNVYGAITKAREETHAV